MQSGDTGLFRNIKVPVRHITSADMVKLAIQIHPFPIITFLGVNIVA